MGNFLSPAEQIINIKEANSALIITNGTRVKVNDSGVKEQYAYVNLKGVTKEVSLQAIDAARQYMLSTSQQPSVKNDNEIMNRLERVPGPPASLGQVPDSPAPEDEP